MWWNRQTRYFEVVVSFARVGSSPVIRTKNSDTLWGIAVFLRDDGMDNPVFAKQKLPDVYGSKDWPCSSWYMNSRHHAPM